MPKTMQKCRVTRIRGSAAHDYGTVQAPSADAAVRKIVAEYQISDPEVLERLRDLRRDEHGDRPSIRRNRVLASKPRIPSVVAVF
jgi:hypothetical protein